MNDTEMLIEVIKPVAFMVQQIPADLLDRVIQEAERFDTIGPILDPAGWQRTHRNVAENLVLLKAMRTFRRAIDGIREREMARIGDTGSTEPSS